MTTLPNYQKDMLDNPIQKMERIHLRRIRMSYFWRGVYLVTMIAMVAPILWGFSDYFHFTLEIILAVLIGLNILSIFVVEMGLINQSADSIRREFDGKTWDLLILTGVNTWQLIVGKWLGVVRGNRRDIVFLYVLRMITVFWGMVIYFLPQDGFQSHRSPINYAHLSDIRIDFEGFIVIGVIMAVYIMVEMLLVSSLPMAFSLFKFTRKSAPWIALGIRVGVPIAIGFFIHAWHYDFPYRFGGVDWRSIHYSDAHEHFIIGIGTALMDNGYGLSATVSKRNHILFNTYPYIFTQLVGIFVYVLWMFGMLRLATFAAHRYNVSAPGFIPKVKPKREIKSKPTLEVVEPKAIPPPKQHIPRQTNILGIQSPALYRCEVMSYDRNMATLELNVSRIVESSPDYQLCFTGVSFFTGVMTWTNAKFEVLNDKHLEQFASNQKLDYGKLPNGSKLYVVRSQGNRFRIVASDVQVEKFTTEMA